MTSRQLVSGQLDVGALDADWVLVFGGVTRTGNRRARQAVETAVNDGQHVFWFDGFVETDPDSGERVPLQIDAQVEAAVTIVDFVDREAATLSGRLRIGSGFQSNPFFKSLWRLFGRRLGLILRPRACWKAVKADVAKLRSLHSPDLIVHGDDYAITSAWMAGRIWRGPRIVAHIPRRKP